MSTNDNAWSSRRKHVPSADSTRTGTQVEVINDNCQRDEKELIRGFQWPQGEKYLKHANANRHFLGNWTKHTFAFGYLCLNVHENIWDKLSTQLNKICKKGVVFSDI